MAVECATESIREECDVRIEFYKREEKKMMKRLTAALNHHLKKHGNYPPYLFPFHKISSSNESTGFNQNDSGISIQKLIRPKRIWFYCRMFGISTAKRTVTVTNRCIV